MRVVSVSTVLFDGYRMERAVEEIALSGAKAVEPAYIKGYVEFDEEAFSEASAVRMRRTLEMAGLPALAVSAHIDLGTPEALPMLQSRVRFAAGIGARYLITNAGAAERGESVFRTLERVIPGCEQSGIVLALENPGHGEGDLLGDGRAGAALVARFASPAIRLNYDAGNVFTYNKECLLPETDFPEARDCVVHLHLKDVLSTPEEWQFTAIGGGSIDFRSLWPLLPADLPVALELPLRLRRPERRDPIRMPQPLDIASLRNALSASLSCVASLDSGDRADDPT